jgi:hypothetical protein
VTRLALPRTTPGLAFVIALLTGGAASAGTNLIEIPVRWCGIKGSPAVENPAGVGEPDTDNALWRRQERASDRVWLNQGTSITFRSAVLGDTLGPNAHFPIIDDPSATPGQPGDILDPNTGNRSEFDAAKNACQAAWNAIPGKTSLTGPIALNARRLVKGDGTENLKGYGEFSYSYSGAAPNICANPPSGNITAVSGAVVVTDYALVRGSDPDEQILAHEFGHALSLEHGNGRDDDNDGPFDGDPNYTNQCDPSENNTDPQSIMNPIATTAKTITSLQRSRARVMAGKYANAQVDPPLVLFPDETIGDEHVDEINEVSEPSIDINSVALTTHTPTQTTTITHQLIDLLPGEPSHQFLAFVDLDGDPATGGAPDDLDLGVPTSFVGAELVTRVVVSYADGIDVTPTLWKFQGGSFVEISDPSIQANIDTTVGGEVPRAQYDSVSITFSNAVRGPMGQSIRLQAFAQTPLPLPPPPGVPLAIPASTSEYDVVPGGIDFQLRIVPAAFPAAGVTPLTARPRQAVSLEVVGLIPNAMVKVFFGDLMVGGGVSDGNGGFRFSFVVPFDSALGERLVTAGNVGTARTGDTSLTVGGTPLPETPVAIDVKPRSCPNPINVKDNGKIPVAILGSATLDVSQLDPSLVRFAGIAPLFWEIEDVTTPFLPITGRRSAKDCTTAGPDGFPDLVLHFDAKAVSAALGAVTNKQVRVLKLTGNLKPELGGAPIVGEDVVITLAK